jgi:hypothetical protein
MVLWKAIVGSNPTSYLLGIHIGETEPGKVEGGILTTQCLEITGQGSEDVILGNLPIVTSRKFVIVRDLVAEEYNCQLDTQQQQQQQLRPLGFCELL